jgi:two-component system, NtrC family, response regulator HydG
MPSAMPHRVLLIDDDQELCETIASALKRRGFDVKWCTELTAGLDMLDEKTEAVVADLRLGDGSGLDVCSTMRKTHPDVPVIVITGYGTLDDAIGAIQVGAYDFINKPVEMEVLALRLERAVERFGMHRQLKRLREAPTRRRRAAATMVGKSPALRKLLQLVDRVKDADASVLITGESGTGKELVARALHDDGPRADGPFVAVNCAAIPETLLESTLFGHVQGAFTDAKTAHNGLLVESNKGTIFLDEIGEMPPSMQVKLLRALQDRKVRPVGGAKEVSFDARVIVATNRDLEDEIRKGNFREDLYFRINVIGIDVPPLRKRGSDVLLLAQYFLERASERESKAIEGMTAEAARALLRYDWPGNVRELENVVEHAVAITRYDRITVGDLPERVVEAMVEEVPGVPRSAIVDRPSLEEVRRRYTRFLVRDTDGDINRAAKILGVSADEVRRTLAEV